MMKSLLCQQNILNISTTEIHISTSGCFCMWKRLSALTIAVIRSSRRGFYPRGVAVYTRLCIRAIFR